MLSRIAWTPQSPPAAVTAGTADKSCHASKHCPWHWTQATLIAAQGLVRLKLERNGIMVADSEPFDELIRSLVKERRERPAPRRSLTPPRRRSRCAIYKVPSWTARQHTAGGRGYTKAALCRLVLHHFITMLEVCQALPLASRC